MRTKEGDCEYECEWNEHKNHQCRRSSIKICDQYQSNKTVVGKGRERRMCQKDLDQVKMTSHVEANLICTQNTPEHVEDEKMRDTESRFENKSMEEDSPERKLSSHTRSLTTNNNTSNNNTNISSTVTTTQIKQSQEMTDGRAQGDQQGGSVAESGPNLLNCRTRSFLTTNNTTNNSPIITTQITQSPDMSTETDWRVQDDREGAAGESELENGVKMDCHETQYPPQMLVRVKGQLENSKSVSI